MHLKNKKKWHKIISWNTYLYKRKKKTHGTKGKVKNKGWKWVIVSSDRNSRRERIFLLFFFFKARFNLSKKLQQRGKIDQLALVENALVLTLFGYTRTSEIFLFYSTFTFCTVYLQYHNYFRKVITFDENNMGETEWEQSS